MKKLIKIIGITILLLLIVILSSPYFFKKRVTTTITEFLNSQINAEVSIDDVSLNFLANFPNASISVSNLHITNQHTFENDTLLSIGNIHINTTNPTKMTRKNFV